MPFLGMGPVKHAGRNGSHPLLLDEGAHEGTIIPPVDRGEVGKHEIRALGRRRFQSRGLQRRQQEPPFLAVVRDERFVVLIPQVVQRMGQDES